ncbi:MAG: SUMF1/EgtB/PvdO family nonheme iron enzyme [Deltaproteobacteria bacterium]|nr:SUMF1/EgtB/PvdO family nonheme iron enzyme [Deltaproteobacteria bacterium]
MSVLLGVAAVSGLNVGSLGIHFSQIPAGIYQIGHANDRDNPVRMVNTSGFELAVTTTTKAHYAAGLRQLGKTTTVLMVESERDRSFSILARGTEAEIGAVSHDELMEIIREMHLMEQRGKRVGDHVLNGALQAFDVGTEFRVIPVTFKTPFEPEIGENDHSMLVTGYEAIAFAALFGVSLPTGEEWEIAARLDLPAMQWGDDEWMNNSCDDDEIEMRELRCFWRVNVAYGNAERPDKGDYTFPFRLLRKAQSS